MGRTGGDAGCYAWGVREAEKKEGYASLRGRISGIAYMRALHCTCKIRAEEGLMHMYIYTS